ncbi:MAG TPA: hypothetical protein VGN64_11395 [Dyadobacter sp.]|jgi:hypothetical protein|nr:hypothetical protein [Dyadobacter sp.]
MKIKITSMCFAIMLLMTAFNAKADIFYVVSGEPFTLNTGLASLHEYNWEITENGNTTTTTLGSASGGILTRTFSLAANSKTAVVQTLKLSVIDILGNCLSNVAQHSIVVLPKLTAVIDSSIDKICQGTDVEALLTANLGATLTDALGIDFTYSWTKVGDAGNTVLSTTSQYTATEVGSYICAIAYKMPTDAKGSSKLLTAITQPLAKAVNITLPVDAPLLSID